MMGFLSPVLGSLGSSAMSFLGKFNIDENNLLLALAGTITAVGAYEIYLSFRQVLLYLQFLVDLKVMIYRCLLHLILQCLLIFQRLVLQKVENVPVELGKHMDKEKFQKSRQYALDKNTFEIVYNLFNTIIGTVSMSRQHIQVF